MRLHNYMIMVRQIIYRSAAQLVATFETAFMDLTSAS